MVPPQDFLTLDFQLTFIREVISGPAAQRSYAVEVQVFAIAVGTL